MKSLETTLREYISKLTVAPIGKVHGQIFFWKGCKSFQVPKCVVYFVIAVCEKSADASSTTRGKGLPCFPSTRNKE